MIGKQLLRRFVNEHGSDLETEIPYSLEVILKKTLSIQNPPELAVVDPAAYKEAIWRAVEEEPAHMGDFYISQGTLKDPRSLFFTKVVVNEDEPVEDIRAFLLKLWDEADKAGMFETRLSMVKLALLSRKKGIHYKGQEVTAYSIKCMLVLMDVKEEGILPDDYFVKLQRQKEPYITFFE